MSRTEKLHLLHKLLIQNRSQVHISRIVQELSCSEKTFFRVRRDVEALYGVEIECINDHFYRYKIEDGEPHHFAGLWFSNKELEGLICFSHALNDIQAGILDEIIAPFKKRLYSLLERFEITDQMWNTRIKCIPLAHRTVNPVVLKTVTDSALRNKRCTITYKALSSVNQEERDISPQTLLRYRDNWYTDAWCHSRNALRTFALSRISSIKQTGADAKTVESDELIQHYTTSYGIFSGKATENAVICFTGIAAEEVSHEIWHPEQQLQWIDKETLHLTVPFFDATELVMDILRWGDMAEVIEPPALREKITKIFENCNKRYSGRRN